MEDRDATVLAVGTLSEVEPDCPMKCLPATSGSLAEIVLASVLTFRPAMSPENEPNPL
jgi:hypothetical protein